MHRALKYVVAALLVVSPSARADTEACARTLERARELHAEGKLHDAIRAMDACTECDALADVCASTKDALARAVPKLTVTVHDCDGAPVEDASVFVDGARVSQGDPIELEPGAHAVRAELAGRREEQTVLVFEHETRRAALMLPNPSRPVPPSMIFFGALSGVTFATAAALWAWAATPDGSVLTGPYAQSNEIHAPQLTHGDLELAAAITLAVAVTTLVTTVVLYATRPFRAPKRHN